VIEYRVDIFDDVTQELVDTCHGPTLAGTCPAGDSRGTVPCAGHRIAALALGPEYWQRWVPQRTRHCPLSWQNESE
jgi:hypothetical protein